MPYDPEMAGLQGLAGGYLSNAGASYAPITTSAAFGHGLLGQQKARQQEMTLQIADEYRKLQGMELSAKTDLERQRLLMEKTKLEEGLALMRRGMGGPQAPQGPPTAGMSPGGAPPQAGPAGPAQRVDPYSRDFVVGAQMSGLIPGELLNKLNERENPNLQFHGGNAIHPQTGQIMGSYPITDANSGMASQITYDAQGRPMQAPVPGAIDTLRQRQETIERAKAGMQPRVTPPLSPGLPPQYETDEMIADRARRAQLPPAPPPAAAPLPTPTPSPDGVPTYYVKDQDTADKLAIIFKDSKSPMRIKVGKPPSDTPIPTSAVVAPPGTPNGAPLPPPGAAAGMSPLAEMEQKNIGEFQAGMIKDFQKEFSAMNQNALSAPAKIDKMKRVGQLLGDFEGGKYSATGLDIASAANSLGLKLDPNLGNKQAAEALSNEVALSLRQTADGAGMPGAMSDADRNFLRSMSPSMSQSADGRAKIIDTNVKILQRQQQVAEFARKYVNKNMKLDNGFFTQLQAWSNAHAIFGN